MTLGQHLDLQMISVQEMLVNCIQFHEFACKDFVNFQTDHLP